jgi:hypothetical protein
LKNGVGIKGGVGVARSPPPWASPRAALYSTSCDIVYSDQNTPKREKTLQIAK